ncbi:GIY-YIG nuclease family protein [Robiginitalea sp. M366]|uniref:GIY-YIG nuclease family protein n=1 Tax=Robiginitalea aestuariiviva TaxID=3036903 RepID=UPI00240D9634|nr:GIY-YIG nuclease family protein [Robiginitalea aestuariiviva]MDG1571388.1 GIY-YIG nuclease family protein [Robiginitalea aestuariiviva]
MPPAHLLYITSNTARTVYYVGVTRNLHRRLTEHENDSKGLRFSYAGKHGCYCLLYLETYPDFRSARRREREIRAWPPERQQQLIARQNPSGECLNTVWKGEV